MPLVPPPLPAVAASIRALGLTAGDRLVVGLSGGVDSLALTYLLLELERSGSGPRVYPVHIDHRLRPDSATAARQVASLSRQLDREIEVIVVDVAGWDRVLQQGVEGAARAARYATLAAAARRFGTSWVAVAHNADDQAEGVLMALLRGGTSEAIGGMRQLITREVPLDPDRATRATISLLRPLLTTPRAEIETFLRTTELEPIEDPSNRSLRYQRNVVRHRVMPVIEAAIPGAAAAIVRAAGLLRSDEAVLTALATEALETVVDTVNRDVRLIGRDRFRELPEAIQRRVLWMALGQLNRSDRRIKGERIEAARLAIAQPGEGTTIEVVDDLVIYLDYETAAIGKSEALLPVLSRESGLPQLRPWIAFNVPLGDTEHRLAGGWVLKLRLRPPLLELSKPLTLRTRRAGDRLADGNGTRLQDLLVDRKVPRYVRDQLPVVAVGSSVMWVGGISPSTFVSKDGALTVTLDRQEPAGARTV
ncbi:MAG TPA: tRNA lysidine(34) synthetase TilS [Thermomicrobiaceae bacterium]|nr:tRNA lysidine(34) synthetase TilS [Thermomicrobiaceae bacterium]